MARSAKAKAPNANEGRRFRQPSLRRSGGVWPGLGRTSVSAGSRVEKTDWAFLSASPGGVANRPRAGSLPIPFGSLFGRFDPASMILRLPQTAEAASISGRSHYAEAEASLCRTPQGFPPVPKHWRIPVRSRAVRPESRDRSLAIHVSLCLTGRQCREILANPWSCLGCSTKLPPSLSLGGSPQRPRSGGFVSRPGLVRFHLSPEGEKPVLAGPQPSLSLAPGSLRPIRLPLKTVTLLRVAKAVSACG